MIEGRPKVCPCCNKPMVGKILVCGICWWRANPLDRSKFRVQFQRSNQPAEWTAIGEKIIRTVKDKLAHERAAIIPSPKTDPNIRKR